MTPPRAFVLAATVALAAAPRALAQSPGERPVAAALSVTDPGSCLDRDALVRHVTSLLGRSTVDAHVEIAVTAAGDGTSGVTIALQRGEGDRSERHLRRMPIECPARIGALALVIAIAIDPNIVETVRVGAAPRSGPAASTQADPARAVMARREPTSVRAVPVRAALAASALLEVLPGIAWGGSVGLGIGMLPWLELRLDAFAAAGSAVSVGRGHADVTLQGGGLHACVVRRLVARVGFSLRGCMGVAAGALVARGRGFDQPSTATFAWPAGRATVEGELTLGRHVGIVLGVNAWVPWLQTRLSALASDGVLLDEVALAPIGGSLTLGPSVTF